jgi:hypothetical protein
MRSKQETSTVINTHLAFNIAVVRMKKITKSESIKEVGHPLLHKHIKDQEILSMGFTHGVPPGTERIMICPIRNI